jgi:hypothetical protein
MGIRTFCQLLSATCDIPSVILVDKKFSIVFEQITKPVGAPTEIQHRVSVVAVTSYLLGWGKDMICSIPAIVYLVN